MNRFVDELFFQSFDASRIEDFLSKISNVSEEHRRTRTEYLAEGLHFQCFVIHANPLELCVNVAKKTFLEKGPRGLVRWEKAMTALRQLDMQDLVPPFQIVRSGDAVALVLPRGKPIGRQGAESRDISEKIVATSKSMGRMGLTLDDYPQLVECRGIHFINDWSDLDWHH